MKKQNFFRLNYPSNMSVSDIATTRGLAGLEPDLRMKLRVGDSILAARYNESARLGEVRLLGKVKRADNALDIDWRPVEFELRPKDGFGQRFWRDNAHFRFADAVAERYMLATRFAEVFEDDADTADSPAAAPVQGDDPGHIYVLKSQYGYKIGKSRRLHDRTRLFAVKLPFDFDVLITGWSPNYSATERDLHRQFAEKRLEGEWFSLDERDLAAIRSRLGAT